MSKVCKYMYCTVCVSALWDEAEITKGGGYVGPFDLNPEKGSITVLTAILSALEYEQ